MWQRTIPTEFHTLKKKKQVEKTKKQKQTINWTQDSEVTSPKSSRGYICPSPFNFCSVTWWSSYTGRNTRGILLPEHAPGAKLLRVYQQFRGYTSSLGAEFPLHKMLHDT